MSKTLEEIRKKLQQLDRRSSPGRNFSDKTVYPHWDIPEGTSTTIRFLSDANEDNTFFWAERQLFKLPFPGIKGQDENKPVVIQIPCIEMWDGKMSCPILNEVRPWWKGDEDLKKTASKYWVKRTYYMQGFVKQDPMNEVEPPENPIRKFIIVPQLYALIKAALLDPEMEHSPVDIINGTDFIITKTSKGGFPDYGTSKWARKESSISEEMQEAISKYGLVDLSTYLPKKPTPEQVAIAYEMFQASLEGELYDPVKWAQHYKPYGFDSSTEDDPDAGEGKKVNRNAPVSRPTIPVPTTGLEVKKPVVTEEAEDPPFEADPPKTEVKVAETAAVPAGKSPQEILAMLRNRNSK